MYAPPVAESTRPLLVMTRIVDAPRAEVFARWQHPEQQARWWDTTGTAAGRVQIEPGADGGFRVRRRGRWTAVTVLAVRGGERLELLWGGDDPATATRITVTFDDHGDQTRLTLRQGVIDRTVPCHLGVYLDRLAELLQATPEP